MCIGALGRAALVAATLSGTSGGALAWQRPKAPSSDKVQTCPEMGEGFVRVAGSDTCIRLGGSVRVETMHAGAGASYFATGH